VLRSTGADFTEPATLHKGWLLEDPATIATDGARTWLQVLTDCTVGPALSGVTVTRTTANQGLLSNMTSVWVGHRIRVESNDYEVTALVPGSGTTATIEVFPNWATSPTDAAVAYTPLSTRPLGLYPSGMEPLTDHGAMGAAETINLADGGYHHGILDAAACTLTFTGATAGKACSFDLEVTQDASGGGTLVYPASVLWQGGTAPAPATDAGAVSLFTFVTRNGGTAWLGALVGADFQ
jgi:hypothetical protein